MVDHVLAALHAVLALALFFTQFCRAVATDHKTRPTILLAFYALTAAAVFAFFAPIILPGWRPSWETVVLMAAMTGVQGATARYWRGNTTPRSFQRDQNDTAVD